MSEAVTPPSTELPNADSPKGSKLLGAFLWLLAFVLMASAAIYQRATGPTYPKKGAVEVAGQSYDYELIRSQETRHGALVVLPDPGAETEAILHWRRYPLQEPFTMVPLTRDEEDIVEALPASEREGARAELAEAREDLGHGLVVAPLPVQPAAGKLEYFLEVTANGHSQRIPAVEEGAEAENIVIRYKDPVPDSILIPHIFFMFFSLMIVLRTALSALVQPRTMRRYAWTALVGMTVGGMVLGPIVQKYAFGAYWTGFPWGYDLTDNKMLIMWVAWIFACSTIGFKPKAK
ncbi:MAG: hypothetical protein AAF517_13045, partial [Planctomycetota bacterium]